MAAPTTPLPDDISVTAEREVLEYFLDYLRIVLVRKAEGITDEQSRWAACPPSDLTIIGLIRHMAEVERSWFRRTIEGAHAPPLFYGDAHPTGDRDGDFHPPDGATLADAVVALQGEIEAARAILATLDDLGQEGHDPQHRNIRWVLVHMIEEYARHCGHADLLRQAIDGTVDD